MANMFEIRWTDDDEPYMDLQDGYRLTPEREDDLDAYVCI